ncbi:MAG: restriction endonuclease subunit S [Candidatus Binatia bacterium]
MIAWQPTALGEVLSRSDEIEEIQPDESYKEITVKLWGKGVVLRGVTGGAKFNGSRRFLARKGQMILSRIDARNGAIGFVPEYLDGSVVSTDFPLFRIDTSRGLPDYLNWLSKTKSFVELCQKASEGTTNRVRLQEDRFLQFEIPLPPLPEQRRIVARIEELAVKINEARGLRQKGKEEAKALLNSARCSLFGQTPRADWLPLSRYVTEIENGKSPQCESRPATSEEWGVLKVGAVSFGSFDERENKALPVGIQFDLRHEVRAGDFLMSRANTTELVGACAIVSETRGQLLLSDKTFRFHFRPDAEIPLEWLDHAMKSPAVRAQIERGASGTSPTMKNISKEKVMSLLLPPHPLPKQRRVVAELDAIGSHLNALLNLQAETAAELEALLPSILDKAFKGEL